MISLHIYHLSNKLINVLTRIRYHAWSRIITRDDALDML